MKKIISISRRTDIPAFYLKWLKNGLRSGEVRYEHPVAGKRTISLRPQDVHTLVFWSKDYSAFLCDSELREYLQPYNMFFHFSITGLGGSFLEPRVPRKEASLEQMAELARTWGVERIEWRFDPIVFWQRGRDKFTNFTEFRSLALQVRKIGVAKCTFSFATLYRKNLPYPRKYQFKYVFPSITERKELLGNMLSIANSLDIALYSCSDFSSAADDGIKMARCIDAERLTQLHPQKEEAVTAKDRSQRPECLCTASIDIGSYKQACQHGCLYCYANPIIPDSLVRSLIEVKSIPIDGESEISLSQKPPEFQNLE